RERDQDHRRLAVEEAAEDVAPEEIGSEPGVAGGIAERDAYRGRRIVRSEVAAKGRDDQHERDDARTERPGDGAQEAQAARHAGSRSFGTSSITSRSATRLSST